MNKFLLLMLAIVSLFATSCSSDDEPEINYAKDVASVYSGYTNASSTYFSDMISENQSVKVEIVSNTTVNVTFDSDTWGHTVISNAEVSLSSEGFIISGKGEAEISGHGGTKKYECNLNAVIGKNKENAKLEFSIPSVMGGLTVKFIQGEAPANLVVAGTYDGYTSTSSAYFKDMITVDQKVMVTANEDGTVSISYTSDTWGEANISNITVTKTGTGYTLGGKGTLAMPSMGGGEPKNYDCDFSGTISSSKDDVEMSFSVPSVMGGTVIKFILGQAPATE